MSMLLNELVADLKVLLGEAAARLASTNDATLQLFINMGGRALGLVKPLQLIGSVTVTANVAEYDAPADFVAPLAPLWGIAERQQRKPWDTNWPPGPLPKIRVLGDTLVPGGFKLFLDPAPTAAQIAALGDSFKFYYRGAYVISNVAGETNVPPVFRDALILRAAVFALRRLAHDGSVKSVQLGNGVSNGPKNGTPGALAEALYDEFLILCGAKAA